MVERQAQAIVEDMRGNLTPEPRVNVLGHVVTKHVRSGDDAASRKAKGIPAPRAHDAVDAPLLDEAFKRLPITPVRAKDFSPEAIMGVEALLETVSNERTSVQWRLDDELRRVLHLFDNNKKQAARTIFNNMAALGEVIIRDLNNELISYVNGFEKCPEFEGIKDFLHDGTPQQRKQAKALVRFISSFGEGPAASAFIDFGRASERFPFPVCVSDVEMRHLIMDYPDRVDEIVGIIGRDYITDPKHLREIIEHDQQALRDGML